MYWWYYNRCLDRQHAGQALRRRTFRSVHVCYPKGQLVVRRQDSSDDEAGVQNSREDEMRAMYCYYHRCLDRQHAGQALRRRMFHSVHVCYLKGQLAARHQDLLGEKTGFQTSRGGLETGVERSDRAVAGLHVRDVPL